MDAIRFDRLTRRLVLGGLTAGALDALLGRDGAASKKKTPSKRKRCRKKKRTFCAGRCCPKGRRCENAACVASCSPAVDCVNTGGFCGGAVIGDCICRATPSGASACIGEPELLCATLTPCSAAEACPRGQVCAVCSCPSSDLSEADFRCYLPCPR